MRPSDIPTLTKLTYPRADNIRRELAELVNYAEINKLSAAAALETWFTAASAAVSAKLATASP